jgi:hypothetical protein
MKGEINMDEYKPNSHRSRENAVVEKKLEKVVTGSVRPRKKNGAQKFADLILPEDIESIGSGIVRDILIPAGKKMLSDIIDTFLYGSAGRAKKNTTASKVSYQGFYAQSNERREPSTPKTKTGYNYEEVVFDNRGDAEEVLMRMEEVISTYGMVSVGDFYDLVGITDDNYTNQKYGWVNLRSANVVRVYDKYMIKFPKALPLD